MAKNQRVIYYDDELNNEFSGSNVKPTKIGPKYKYISRNPFYCFFSFIAYRLIATPIAFLFKWFRSVKFENRKVLKKFKKQGYFVFANHTNAASDVLSPHLINFPTKTILFIKFHLLNITFLIMPI